MATQKQPSTSKDAFDSITDHQLRKHYEIILEALQHLRLASAEQIASFVNMDHSQINRRLSEMKKLNLIYRPGTKAPTLSGRSAYHWTLRTKENNNELDIEELRQGKSVLDFSREINNIKK